MTSESDPGVWNICLFGTRVVAPHALGFEGGGVWDVPPFRIFDAGDPRLGDWLSTILQDKSSLRIVSDADPSLRDEKQFLRSMGAASRKKYYESAREWSVTSEAGYYDVLPWIKSSEQRGLVVDFPAAERLRGLTLESVVDYLAREISKPDEAEHR